MEPINIEAESILNAVLGNIVNGIMAENEIIECKTVSPSFSDENLGQYFSALSNEANLANRLHAWMIFGITNKGEVQGTQYLQNPHALNKTKKYLADNTIDRHTFSQICEFQRNGKRILMMAIPAAVSGMPMPYKGHYYSREGESTVPLPIHKFMQIINQQTDWSAKIVSEATIDDLDEAAIKTARTRYKQRFPQLSEEIDIWDNLTFLNKSKILSNGKITNAAILLLGKTESEHFISPAQAKIKWILKDENGFEIDYLIVSCPFLLTVEDIFNRIINLKYRYLQPGTLSQIEVNQYDSYLLHELLNNAIAHQDYTKSGAITIVQKKDTILFTNPGTFIPGSVQTVIERDSPETHMRNLFLANTMSNYMMVDTIGSGIKRMFMIQKKKYFPFPDYRIDDTKVSVLVTGKILDLEYANILAGNSSLSLADIILLDKVQKKQILNDTEYAYLRKKKLIRGRKPNIVLSNDNTITKKQTPVDTKTRTIPITDYETILLKRLTTKSLTRKEIDDIIYPLLPPTLLDKQKYTKVNHLLNRLRKNGKIINTGTQRMPNWERNPEK